MRGQQILEVEIEL